jgi:hypothetical protein
MRRVSDLLLDGNGYAKFEELLSYDVLDLHRMDRNSHVG